MFILIAVNLSFSLRTPAISQRTMNVLDPRQARLKHDSLEFSVLHAWCEW